MCLTGDVFNSQRCDCGEQLLHSLNLLSQQPAGILIYVRDHEGRGIGLTQKVRAYHLQQLHGLDTYQANEALGLAFDSRDYTEVNAMLEDVAVTSVELITNNPLKVDAISVPVTKVRALRTEPSAHNSHYLEAKMEQERTVLEQLMTNGLALDGPKGHLVSVLQRSTAHGSNRHEGFMARALELAMRGRVSAPPNPWVGCVIVDDDGQVVGEGFHHAAGQPHAEIEALRNAAQRYSARHNEEYRTGDTAVVTAAVQGCTAYVTLEPCHHQGRTPPCDMALIKFGIARVVIAVTDPDSRVDSAGIALLRSHGIEVITDVYRQQVLDAMQPYLHQRSTGRPFVVLKAGCSMDGKIACPDGTSQWITSSKSRQLSHALRAESQAILVGATTAIVDKPRLNPRVDLTALTDPELKIRHEQPRGEPLLRVVLDGQGKLREGPLLETESHPTLVFTTEHCPSSTTELWQSRGVEVKVVTGVKVEDSVHLDLEMVLQHLGERGVLQLLVEGGAAVQGQFLEQKLVDELHLFYGNTMLGLGGRDWPQVLLAPTIAKANRWKLKQAQQVDDDLWATYTPETAAACIAEPE